VWFQLAVLTQQQLQIIEYLLEGNRILCEHGVTSLRLNWPRVDPNIAETALPYRRLADKPGLLKR
jgi:hypothetical protein